MHYGIKNVMWPETMHERKIIYFLLKSKIRSRSNYTMKKRQEKLTQNNICLSAMEFGTTVLLKSANEYLSKEPMAYATFLSSDPDAQVHGFKLGNQFWKMRVNYPIEEHEMLVRPWENYKIIGQTKGKAIA